MKRTARRLSRWSIVIGLLAAAFGVARAGPAAPELGKGETKRNNLVTELVNSTAVAEPNAEFTFARAAEGWVFIAATFNGTGGCTITLDPASRPHTVIVHDAKDGPRAEAMRHVAKGEHQLRVECTGNLRIARLVITAIPELIHCGLGFDPAIKSYGRYDPEFLKKDILPNVTTLIVPHNIALPRPVIEGWHRQGKQFAAEVGINGQARTAEDHFKYWTSFLDTSPFLNGIIVNEFIVNNPSTPAGAAVGPERQARVDREQQRHRVYEEAIKKLRADARYSDKSFYAYVGGSGKKLNQEMIGPSFIRTLLDSNCRIALERYLHEMSSEKGSKDALETFVDGIADWEAKEPGVKQKMVIAFGLFSMPPGGLNKLPNVDYHVWMDQQMNVVANHPRLAGIGGLEWWTSLQADEETVRFVGKLYRHYAIEGRTDRLTRDPLFTSHLRNADFEGGLEGWTVRPAESGSITTRSFPRYGRIEGRFMGLGRPADPEHIGDTFLWMKRNAKGPNTVSQTVKDLEPGRLYSMKMFSCDYQDLVNPKAKTRDEATPFIGKVVLEEVEVDPKRSFTEMYASNPEPRIPVWITYHWKVFRATGTTAKVVVSDWPNDTDAMGTFGQEQTFNFLEIQPYHE
ncbi:MAG TPA: hypothetical protein VL371_18880 [Gemmataceae bacterium]|nr:hypothetical protein [Gemmataceae bacterium]